MDSQRKLGKRRENCHLCDKKQMKVVNKRCKYFYLHGGESGIATCEVKLTSNIHRLV